MQILHAQCQAQRSCSEALCNWDSNWYAFWCKKIRTHLFEMSWHGQDVVLLCKHLLEMQSNQLQILCLIPETVLPLTSKSSPVKRSHCLHYLQGNSAQWKEYQLAKSPDLSRNLVVFSGCSQQRARMAFYHSWMRQSNSFNQPILVLSLWRDAMRHSPRLKVSPPWSSKMVCLHHWKYAEFQKGAQWMALLKMVVQFQRMHKNDDTVKFTGEELVHSEIKAPL